MDTTNDVKALSVTGLAYKNLVEIRDHYRVWGSTKQDSLVEVASAIIDPYYEKMKQEANMSRILAVATRPQTVKSLCLSVIPGSVC